MPALPCPLLGLQGPDKWHSGRLAPSLPLCGAPIFHESAVPHPDFLTPSPACPGKPSRGKGQPGKIICIQTPHPSPLPVLVGAENGNQGNALLFNRSLEERGGLRQEQDAGDRHTGVGAGWRGEERKSGRERKREGMQPENEKGVGIDGWRKSGES